MATTINSNTTDGLVITPDTSGEIKLQSAGADIVSVTANGMAVDTNTLYVDATNNRVGIGTSSPERQLEVTTNLEDQIRISDITGDGWEFRAGTNLIFKDDGTERMRIDSSGRVLIGTTSLGSNIAEFYVSGNIGSEGVRGRQGINGTSNGNLMNTWWSGSALQAWVDTTNIGNFSISSDYRVKRNIETQNTPALSRISQLRPVTYQPADYGTLFTASDEIKEGFIAHELAEVIPSAVDGEKDSEHQIQSLKLDALCSVMVKAIQEQQEQITALETRIQALENS